MDASLTPWHMGQLHTYEQVLVLLLAFGPFLALGVVIAWRRRADRLDEAAQPSADMSAPTWPNAEGPAEPPSRQ